MSAETDAEQSAAFSLRAAWRADRRWLLAWAGVISALTTFPYLLAWALTPAGGAFGGLLANPLDGQTYLAKLAQGAAGAWLFRLSFTSEPHQGAFLYFYYLGLGQIAGRLGLSLPLMYHLARLINGLLFMGAAWALIALLAPASRRLAWLLLFLSSGLGWLSAPLGHLTADLLVPEAIAFYTLYTNPHFPLALAALVSLLTLLFLPLDAPAATRLGWRRTAGAALAAALIALTQAFLFILVALLAGLLLALRWQRTGRLPRRELQRGAIAALPALALTLPQWLALIGNPALRAMSAQDINLSPPVWDYLLTFAPLLPLAAWGAWQALRRRDAAGLFLFAWAVLNLALAYAPSNLQRRLIMGAQIPLALLAARGWGTRPLRRAGAWLIAGAAIGNLFLLALGLAAAARGDPQLYLLPDEPPALAWLAQQPAAGAVIALPRSSAFIPGRTNQPVYYGHPMETLDAKRKEAAVRALFAGQGSDLLNRPDVGWLYIGPYERAQAAPAFLESLASRPTAYQRGSVTIYPLGAGASVP